MFGSMSGATERIGPTGRKRCEWNTAAKPGEAALDDLLEDDVGDVETAGRPAGGVLSIFTTSAARCRAASLSSGTPVSGCRIVGGRRGASWTTTWWSSPSRSSWSWTSTTSWYESAASPPPPQAAATSASAVSARSGRRACTVRAAHSLSQQGDPLVERRVGVEQLSDAAQLALVADATRAAARSTLAGGRWRGGHDGLVVLQLLQRRDQPRRVAGELAAAHVGQRLAPPAHRELHELGRRTARGSASARPRSRPGCCRRRVAVAAVAPAATT